MIQPFAPWSADVDYNDVSVFLLAPVYLVYKSEISHKSVAPILVFTQPPTILKYLCITIEIKGFFQFEITINVLVTFF